MFFFLFLGASKPENTVFAAKMADLRRFFLNFGKFFDLLIIT